MPRFETPRNYERETLGPEVAEIARALSFEPMPWNLDNWDVMYEYTLVDDPRWGLVQRLWYREARITVPRQSSKTTSTLVRHVDRMVNGAARGWGTRPVAAFTMQHASDARLKMVEEWMPIVEGSPWSPDLELETSASFVLSNGKEAIKWPGHGRMGTFPPNKSGAHGGVLDLVDIDEAFAFYDDRAEAGSRPAMITRPSPQIVVQSTMGTAESHYLNDKVKDGRERVESGLESHVYYLEYAADPERHDIHNPEHWPEFMPALGYTQTLEALEMEHDAYMGSDEPDKGEAGWARAFCNMRTEVLDRIIPADSWEACFDIDAMIERGGRVWMAADASPSLTGNRWGAITISGYTPDGKIVTEVVEHAPGLGWMAKAIGALTRVRTIESVRVDPKSPVRSVLDDIKNEANATVLTTDAEVMGAACTRYHEDIIGTKAHPSTARHRGQAMLNAAVEGAAKRTLLDAWAFARRTSSSDICPLVSAVQSHWDAAINPQRGIISMAVG